MGILPNEEMTIGNREAKPIKYIMVESPGSRRCKRD